jgi:hypothetical protein
MVPRPDVRAQYGSSLYVRFRFGFSLRLVRCISCSQADPQPSLTLTAVKPQCTQFGACMDPLDVESSYLYDTQYKRRLRTAWYRDGYES